MTTLSTTDVIRQFNEAFVTHQARLLDPLLAEGCVMEAIEPAPTGARVEGRDACLAFWTSLASDPTSQFRPEEVIIAHDRATILWTYRYGAGPEDYVRGVNVMTVADGLIVEALGYSKTTGTGSAQLSDLLGDRPSPP